MVSPSQTLQYMKAHHINIDVVDVGCLCSFV